MADYTDIGFNEHLQATDSLPAQESEYITSTQADAIFEGLGAAQITQGAVTSELTIKNKGRILVYNGTIPQVLIGFDEGGF